MLVGGGMGLEMGGGGGHSRARVSLIGAKVKTDKA